MQRYATLIAIAPGDIAEYKRLHKQVWPDVLRQIKASNMANYSIFLRQPENLLFSYYEYWGTDHGADMAAMAADPVTQGWWALCRPLLSPLPELPGGEFNAPMTEVFHID